MRSSPAAPPSSVKDIKVDYESGDDDDDFVGCDDQYDQYHNEYDSDHCGSD